MIRFAHFFRRVNYSIFTFFSGIFVSFSLNLFTGILLDPSLYFTLQKTISLVLILLGSGALMVEPILQQRYVEEVKQINTIGISLSSLLETKKVKKAVRMLIFVLFLALLFIISGIILFCFFNT